MVQFSRNFSSLKVSRHSAGYLDYSGLKLYMYQCGSSQSSPSPPHNNEIEKTPELTGNNNAQALDVPLLEQVEDGIEENKYISPGVRWLEKLDAEIKRVFDYESCLRSSVRDKVLHIKDAVTSKGWDCMNKEERRMYGEELKGVYREWEEIQSFKALNDTAIMKVEKKARKYHEDWMRGRKERGAEDEGGEEFGDDIIEEWRSRFGGSKLQAVNELRSTPPPPSSSLSVLLGFRSGLLITLLLWLIWDLLFDDPKNVEIIDTPTTWGWSFTLCAIMVHAGYGVCKIMWSDKGINADYLLGFNEAKSTDGGRVIVARGLGMGVGWTVGILMFIKIRRDAAGVIGRNLPPWITQVAVFGIVVVQSVWPWRKRRGVFEGIWETVKTPWGRVTFRENLIADGLTSAVKVNTALAYTLCYYISGDFLLDQSTLSISSGEGHCSSSSTWASIIIPLISVMPLLWRLMQCVKRYRSTGSTTHIGNAGKYTAAFGVVVFGVFHDQWLKSGTEDDNDDDEVTASRQAYRFIWIAVFIVATLYQFWWDVFMDWGLRPFGLFRGWLDGGKTQPQRLFSPKLYVMFVPLDLILRFLWTLSLIPYNSSSPFGSELSRALDPFLAAAEVFRRLAWALVRVENEHLSNTSKYRRIFYVPGEQKRDEEKRNVMIEVLGVIVVVASVTAIAFFTP